MVSRSCSRSFASREHARSGLSWALILSKRSAHRAAFHAFDVRTCAAMSTAQVKAIASDDTKTGSAAVVKHCGKLASVPRDARCLLKMHADDSDEHRTLPGLLWSFVGGTSLLNNWASKADIPPKTQASLGMSDALKARGFKFVGPTCYSLMQSCGTVMDHSAGTPQWAVAKQRLRSTGPCVDQVAAVACLRPARQG